MNTLETIRATGACFKQPPAPKKGRKRLAPRSKKRAIQNKEYLRLRKEFLGAHPYCETWRGTECCLRSTDIHHVHGRGKNLCNVKTWLAVCRPCHNWIHARGKEARALGLLK